MKDWHTLLFKAFYFTSVLCFLISFLTNSITSYHSLLFGYVFYLLTVIFILFIKLTQHSFTLYHFLFTYFQYIIIFLTLLFILFINITFKKKIIDKHISSSFFGFQHLLIFLYFLQFYIIYQNVYYQNTLQSLLLYLFSLFIIILESILYTLCYYFSTDGYENINKKNID
jgi:hypothetical protein